jgi:ubiquinone/menaquinone biosynthesis C-methylase UbiE
MRGIEQIPWLYDAGMAVQDRFGLGMLVGLDPAREVIPAAKKRAPGVRLVVGSAEALPFADGSFDTVVSSLVFCSVPDPDRGLREVHRVLAPGGRLAMMEHVRSTSALVGRLQDAIQPAWTCVLGGCHPNRDTEAAVRRAGFAIDSETRRAKGAMRLFLARRT